jgi:hypothetical protein
VTESRFGGGLGQIPLWLVGLHPRLAGAGLQRCRGGAEIAGRGRGAGQHRVQVPDDELVERADRRPHGQDSHRVLCPWFLSSVVCGVMVMTLREAGM